MSAIKRVVSTENLIDFSSTRSTRMFEVNAGLSFGSVAIAHCTSRPIEGRYVGAHQITVAIHDGPPFELEWHEVGSDHIRRGTIADGQMHIGDSHNPFWVRSAASPSFLAFALEESFVNEIWHNAFDVAGEFAIRPLIGVQDPVVRRLGELALQEVRGGGSGGRLYAESLAAMLSVHLLRSYGSSSRSPVPHKGGLAPLTMGRILEYIEAHLDQELGVIELAAVAGLSPHHFGVAFKTSVGMPPHQFVIDRRIRHALHLLRNEDRSIAQVARAAGFSSQSHFTTSFRRMTGMTPARFRQSLGVWA